MKEIHINGRTITLKKVVKLLLKKISYIPNKFLELFDLIIPKRNDYWIFPVYFLGNNSFNDNLLAIFKEVKDDKNIKKIILTRKKKIQLDGKNVVIIPITSFFAIYYLLVSKVIIFQHSLIYEMKNFPFLIKNFSLRILINLWHGIPIKNIANKDVGFMTKELAIESSNHYFFVSSLQDKKCMEQTFYNTPKDHFYISGLPRNDFLLLDEKELPKILYEDINRIDKLIGNKKLIAYLPTYRDPRKNSNYFYFSDDEIFKIMSILKEKNAVFGFKYHSFNLPINIINRLSKLEGFVNLDCIENTATIIRKSDLVITDYSSLFLDALYCNKQLCSFAYDYKNYIKNEHGFFYDFEKIFPGKIVYNFNELISCLESYNSKLSKEEMLKYENIKKIFFEYKDTYNSKRVIKRIKEII